MHAKERLLPVLEERLFAHDDALDLNGGLLQSVAGGGRFFFLRDQLGLIERLLLVEPLDLLIHGVDEDILLLLGLFEVADVLLSAVGRASCNGDLTLHHLVVLLDLLQSAVQLVQLFLGLEHTLKLLVSFFLLALILSLEDLMLAFGLTSVPLYNIVVIVRPFKCSLHAGKLVLHSIELHTSLFTLLADLAHGLLAFAKFQVDTLMLIRQLFR